MTGNLAWYLNIPAYSFTKKNTVMEKLEIKTSWGEVKRKVKDAYPTLTEADLNYEEGKEEELLERLEIETGREREDLIQWINQLSRVSM
jgi:hypothetical protein